MWRCASVSQGQTATKQAPCVRLGLAPLKEGKKIEALTHLKLIAVVLVKRWFPVNSCSKFGFLTESSRLLWICNTLLLMYNYSLLTCSKENVHLVLYSGFLCSFYKICCSWQQASLLVDECGVSSLCPEMAAQGPFSLSIFPQRLLPSKRWPEQMHHKPRGLTQTPTHALILFFNFFNFTSGDISRSGIQAFQAFQKACCESK